MITKPFLCNDGVVVTTDGELIDWDDKKFNKLCVQIKSSPHVKKFENIYIDQDAFSEFKGEMSVFVDLEGLCVKLTHDNQTCYIHAIPVPLEI